MNQFEHDSLRSPALIRKVLHTSEGHKLRTSILDAMQKGRNYFLLSIDRVWPIEPNEIFSPIQSQSALNWV